MRKRLVVTLVAVAMSLVMATPAFAFTHYGVGTVNFNYECNNENTWTKYQPGRFSVEPFKKAPFATNIPWDSNRCNWYTDRNDLGATVQLLLIDLTPAGSWVEWSTAFAGAVWNNTSGNPNNTGTYVPRANGQTSQIQTVYWRPSNWNDPAVQEYCNNPDLLGYRAIAVCQRPIFEENSADRAGLGGTALLDFTTYGNIRAAAVWIDVELLNRQPNAASVIVHVAVHELGHALALAHEDSSTCTYAYGGPSVMNAGKKVDETCNPNPPIYPNADNYWELRLMYGQ